MAVTPSVIVATRDVHLKVLVWVTLKLRIRALCGSGTRSCLTNHHRVPTQWTGARTPLNVDSTLGLMRKTPWRSSDTFGIRVYNILYINCSEMGGLVLSKLRPRARQKQETCKQESQEKGEKMYSLRAHHYVSQWRGRELGGTPGQTVGRAPT